MTTAELIELLKGEKKNILSSQGKPAVAGDEHAQIAPLNVREDAPADLPPRPEQGDDESNMEFQLRMRDWQREVAKAKQTANDMRSADEATKKTDEPEIHMDPEVKIKRGAPAPDAGVPDASKPQDAQPQSMNDGDGDEEDASPLRRARDGMVSFKPAAKVRKV